MKNSRNLFLIFWGKVRCITSDFTEGAFIFIYAFKMGVKEIYRQILSNIIIKSIICVMLLYCVVINSATLEREMKKTDELKWEAEYWESMSKSKENKETQKEYARTISRINGIKREYGE